MHYFSFLYIPCSLSINVTFFFYASWWKNSVVCFLDLLIALGNKFSEKVIWREMRNKGD